MDEPGDYRNDPSDTWTVSIVVAVLAMGLLGAAVVLMLQVMPRSTRPVAARSHCKNNLKQIGLALWNYHDEQGTFPPASVAGADGTPLYSWRVLLLPYLDQEPLYREFHLDEPWNSEHNKQLLTKIPEVYRCPAHRDRSMPCADCTHYAAVVGEGCVFDGTRVTRIDDVADGAERTLIAAEITDKRIPWSAPLDVELNATLGLDGFSSEHPGGFHALYADGSVHMVRDDVRPDALRAAAIYNDGKPVGALPGQ
jgi:prepilin-type processing-associated H-X9-DG protein